LRFYTREDCEEWLRGRERSLPGSSPEISALRLDYPPENYRYFFIARWIAQSLTDRLPALLWITEWGIWPSSENWHLYHKLRQTYSDHQLLHEAPRHLFLEHEAEDLASFLHVAMLNGWGGYVLPHANRVNVFFSHDEYIDFFAEHEQNLEEVSKGLGAATLRK